MTIDDLCKFLRREIRIQSEVTTLVYSASDSNMSGYSIQELLSHFIPYTEPPRKRKVTQYRYTYQREGADGKIFHQTGRWDSDKEPGCKDLIVHTETREIEVEDKS